VTLWNLFGWVSLDLIHESGTGISRWVMALKGRPVCISGNQIFPPFSANTDDLQSSIRLYSAGAAPDPEALAELMSSRKAERLSVLSLSEANGFFRLTGSDGKEIMSVVEDKNGLRVYVNNVKSATVYKCEPPARSEISGLDEYVRYKVRIKAARRYLLPYLLHFMVGGRQSFILEQRYFASLAEDFDKLFRGTYAAGGGSKTEEIPSLRRLRYLEIDPEPFPELRMEAGWSFFDSAGANSTEEKTFEFGNTKAARLGILGDILVKSYDREKRLVYYYLFFNQEPFGFSMAASNHKSKALQSVDGNGETAYLYATPLDESVALWEDVNGPVHLVQSCQFRFTEAAQNTEQQLQGIEILHESGMSLARYALFVDGKMRYISANRFFHPDGYLIRSTDLRNNAALDTQTARAYADTKIVRGLTLPFLVFSEEEYTGDDPRVISTLESVAVFEKKYDRKRSLTVSYIIKSELSFNCQMISGSCFVTDETGGRIALIEMDTSFSKKSSDFGFDGIRALSGDFLLDERYTVTVEPGYDKFLQHIFHAFQAIAHQA
jgi:hypothetical protein